MASSPMFLMRNAPRLGAPAGEEASCRRQLQHLCRSTEALTSSCSRRAGGQASNGRVSKAQLTDGVGVGAMTLERFLG